MYAAQKKKLLSTVKLQNKPSLACNILGILYRDAVTFSYKLSAMVLLEIHNSCLTMHEFSKFNYDETLL